MDDLHLQRYQRWRTEAARLRRVAAEPPAASRLPAKVDVAAIRLRLGRVLGAKAQFDTLRLHLIKLAVRVVEMKTQVKLHLPSTQGYRI